MTRKERGKKVLLYVDAGTVWGSCDERMKELVQWAHESGDEVVGKIIENPGYEHYRE